MTLLKCLARAAEAGAGCIMQGGGGVLDFRLCLGAATSRVDPSGRLSTFQLALHACSTTNKEVSPNTSTLVI